MRTVRSIVPPRRTRAAFTMMEIAICLAIIGFALVAIIGVLPLGMNTQRDNREQTIINQDASVLINDIRSGVRGGYDLTNYVYAITNYWTLYSANGTPLGRSDFNGYTLQGAYVSAAQYNPSSPNNGGPYSAIPLTNNAAILSLLSTPEFIARAANFPSVPNLPFAYWNYGSVTVCFSNHIVAYVHSISGLAAQKPPQNNPIMEGSTFSYRLYCVNTPVAVDTNFFNLKKAAAFTKQLAANQQELRMTFLWPQHPNGTLGGNRHTFRVTIAGQLQWVTNYHYGLSYYFYQPQTFTNAP